jgi:hypothetical protein
MRAERRINSLRRTSIATVEQGWGGRLASILTSRMIAAE